MVQQHLSERCLNFRLDGLDAFCKLHIPELQIVVGLLGLDHVGVSGLVAFPQFVQPFLAQRLQSKVLAVGLGPRPAQASVEFFHIHAQAAEQLGELARGLAGGDGLLQRIGQGFNFHGFRELDHRARQQIDRLIRLIRIVKPGGEDVGQRLHHFICVARNGIELAGLVVQLFHAHAGVLRILLQERQIPAQFLRLLQQLGTLADYCAQCVAD